MSACISFDDYVKKLPKLSDTKLKILFILWRDDKCVFPKPWRDSSELLELTQQKNFDRRIRDLKTEAGCDIEGGNDKLNYRYRLKSPIILPTINLRSTIQKHKKVELFRKNKYKCNVCGKLSGSGITGLQADHRVPLSRNGMNEDKNFQPLCNHCNAVKRSSCVGCTQDCQTCHWAFPERTGRHSMFRLAPEILKPLEKHFGSKHEVEKVLTGMLNEYSQFIVKINGI